MQKALFTNTPSWHNHTYAFYLCMYSAAATLFVAIGVPPPLKRGRLAELWRSTNVQPNTCCQFVGVRSGTKLTRSRCPLYFGLYYYVFIIFCLVATSFMCGYQCCCLATPHYNRKTLCQSNTCPLPHTIKIARRHKPRECVATHSVPVWAVVCAVAPCAQLLFGLFGIFSYCAKAIFVIFPPSGSMCTRCFRRFPASDAVGDVALHPFDLHCGRGFV